LIDSVDDLSSNPSMPGNWRLIYNYSSYVEPTKNLGKIRLKKNTFVRKNLQKGINTYI